MSKRPEEIYPDYCKVEWKLTDSYIVEYEIFDGNLYAHVDVFDNPITSMKKLKKEDWPKFKQFIKEQGFDEFFTYTNNLKFCEKFEEYEYIGYTGYIPELDKGLHIVSWRV